MIPDKDTRDIIAYLDRTLPHYRIAEIEDRLKADKEFREKFEEQKHLLEFLEKMELEELLNENMPVEEPAAYEDRLGKLLDELELDAVELDEEEKAAIARQKKNSQKPASIIFLLRNKKISYGLGAAASVLLIVFSYLYFYPQYRTKMLFGHYYASETFSRSGDIFFPSDSSKHNWEKQLRLLSPFGGDKIGFGPDRTQTNFLYIQKGISSYSKREYAKAIEELRECDEDPYFYRSYFEGLSHLAMNQLAPAIENLEKSLDSDQRQLKQHAEWYLGLAWLLSENQNLASETFRKIAEDHDHDYREAAAELYRKLDKK